MRNVWTNNGKSEFTGHRLGTCFRRNASAQGKLFELSVGVGTAPRPLHQSSCAMDSLGKAGGGSESCVFQVMEEYLEKVEAE